jgi:DNA-binding MarR family transcriptional regulator
MSDPDGADAMFDALRRFQASMVGETMEFWLQIRLTPPQMGALHLIRLHGRLSGRQLAKALSVSPGAVVALCDRLQERGLVERVPDDVDRRVTWFQLTPAGEHIFTRLQELGSRVVSPALRALSAEDRAHLIRILNLLADRVEAVQTAKDQSSDVTAATNNATAATESTTIK